MIKINFTQFELRTPLLTSDYLVGYKNDGSTEIRTTVNDILNLIPLPSDDIINLIGIKKEINVNSVVSPFSLNIVTGENSASIYGNNNTVNSNNSFIGGISNSIFANNCFVHGNENEINAENTVQFGSNNIINGENQFCFGSNNNITNEFNYVFGNNVICNNLKNAIFCLDDFSEDPFTTTEDKQFIVLASGGILLYDKVSIGTDSLDNALTVVGDISATGNLKVGTITPPPVNTTTPVAWTDVYIDNTLYKLPLYQ